MRLCTMTIMLLVVGGYYIIICHVGDTRQVQNTETFSFFFKLCTHSEFPSTGRIGPKSFDFDFHSYRIRMECNLFRIKVNMQIAPPQISCNRKFQICHWNELVHIICHTLDLFFYHSIIHKFTIPPSNIPLVHLRMTVVYCGRQNRNN